MLRKLKKTIKKKLKPSSGAQLKPDPNNVIVDLSISSRGGEDAPAEEQRMDAKMKDLLLQTFFEQKCINSCIGFTPIYAIFRA